MMFNEKYMIWQRSIPKITKRLDLGDDDLTFQRILTFQHANQPKNLTIQNVSNILAHGNHTISYISYHFSHTNISFVANKHIACINNKKQCPIPTWE